MPTRRELANALRALSMDAVQQAKSGHPGAPMGLADVAEVLWNDYLKHNPTDPSWVDRDRFVLSNGHASMLLYSLLHLSGYDLKAEDLRQFRQLHSRTPGHPEYGLTPGVETTTGPLGQGLANAVGMALSERLLGETFNRDEHRIVDHYTYVVVGDGCMMEGISHEASSLAGTLRLGKLICFYDDNGISIDGEVSGWFNDDTAARFKAYGWHVIAALDGHDPDALVHAIDQARSVNDRPSLICCRTTIGFGAPNLAGSHHTHGAPLGPDEVAATRANLGWSDPPFEVPDEIRAAWDVRERGRLAQADWERRFQAYRDRFPELAQEFERRMRGDLPHSFEKLKEVAAQAAQQRGTAMATRKASQNALDVFGPELPELFGGSADLTPSNNTKWSGSVVLDGDRQEGNYLHFGVREFAMSAMANGMALHGGLIPYVGTFLVFSDYARNAVRMAALMGIRSIFVYTHDSIGVGEDGPTHQPIEHLSSLRLIPGLSVWRPCDETESMVAWTAAIERKHGPTCLLFSRQDTVSQKRLTHCLYNVRRGGYILADCEGEPEAIVIATGSEVAPAVVAAQTLGDEGHRVRVVSMPSVDTFEAQDPAYREVVLPANVSARVTVEAGVTAPWHRYATLHGCTLGLDRFGASAPGGVLMQEFGFTPPRIAAALRQVLNEADK